MIAYKLLAVAVLATHLIWIVWVIFGYFVARNHRTLRWLHIASLFYGIFIEVAPWPCPLTLAEQWFEAKAGIAPYSQPFLVHYLEALIYPDIPESALIAGAVAVCALNLWLYLRRRWRNGRMAA